jgi:hypothetical protein
VETELPPDPVPAPEIAPAPATVLTTAQVPEAPPYRDRSTGLMIFGIIQIILGLLAALMVPLIGLSAVLSRVAPAGHLRPIQYIASSAAYVFIAATLLVLGLGSISIKRWARALTLIVSWYCLVTGVLMTILLTAVLPVAMRGILAQARQATAAPSPDIPTSVMAVILTVMIVFIAFFMIIVPLAFVLFYSRQDVEQTCRYRDPVARWTDRTPLPVLGASVIMFIGAVSMLVTAISAPVFPFFGRYLSGVGGTACFFVVGFLDLYLAFAIFRLQVAGWWIAVLALLARLVSMGLTYAKADLMFAYSKMGMSDQQLELLRANPMFRGHVILWWSLLSLLIFFGYLLWLKRYFKRPEATSVANPVSDGLTP